MSEDPLQIEIQEVKGDIQSLHLEIDVLDKDYLALLSQVKDLEESLSHLDEPHTLQEISGHSKANYDIDGPPVIKNSYFDESIRKYFSNISDEEEEGDTEIVTKRQKLDNIANDFKVKSETILEMKQNILYENIFRFGGVTSFPLNPFLFDANDEIIGLRFDIFSHYKHKFITPHYVILRKIKHAQKGQETTMKWEVYRHTLPVYLPITEYSECLHEEEEELAFKKFTLRIRDHLIQIQYKHDKFDSLRNIKYGHISKNKSANDKAIIEKLEKDLECQRVSIILLSSLLSSKRLSEINLVCSNDEIKEARCLVTGVDSNDTIILQCESLLKNCKLKELIKTFKTVIGHLIASGKL